MALASLSLLNCLLAQVLLPTTVPSASECWRGIFAQVQTPASGNNNNGNIVPSFEFRGFMTGTAGPQFSLLLCQPRALVADAVARSWRRSSNRSRPRFWQRPVSRALLFIISFSNTSRLTSAPHQLQHLFSRHISYLLMLFPGSAANTQASLGRTPLRSWLGHLWCSPCGQAFLSTAPSSTH